MPANVVSHGLNVTWSKPTANVSIPKYPGTLVRYLLAVTALVLLSQCHNPSADEHSGFVKLALVAQKEDFGSFGVLSGSQGMNWSEGLLYFSDSEQSRVLVLDRNLNVMRQMGKPGEGPGELTLAGPLVCYRDRLFVTNMGAAGLSVFDTQGTFLSAIPVSYCIFSTQFAVYDEMLFLSTPQKESAISVADMEGALLFQFGERFQFGEERENITRSYRHLTVVETAEMPLLIAVAESEPVIEAFSLDGVRQYVLNLETHPLLQSRLNTAKEFRERNPDRRANSSVVLFVSIAAHGQSLYLLVADQSSPHHFLKFQVTSKSINYQEALELKDPVAIQAFTVDDRGEILLFDAATSQLHRYTLVGGKSERR